MQPFAWSDIHQVSVHWQYSHHQEFPDVEFGNFDAFVEQVEPDAEAGGGDEGDRDEGPEGSGGHRADECRDGEQGPGDCLCHPVAGQERRGVHERGHGGRLQQGQQGLAGKARQLAEEQAQKAPVKMMIRKSLEPGATVNSDLGEIGYDQLARAMGAYGERVSSPADLTPAIERSLDSGKCAVIHVDVDPVKHMWAPGLLHFKKMHQEPGG